MITMKMITAPTIRRMEANGVMLYNLEPLP